MNDLQLRKVIRENISMTQLKPGDVAPNFILQTVEGASFSMQEILRSGQNVLLVFLRHLG